MKHAPGFTKAGIHSVGGDHYLVITHSVGAEPSARKGRAVRNVNDSIFGPHFRLDRLTETVIQNHLVGITH